MNYDEFFKKATKNPEPYPFQRKLATAEEMPQLLDVPTGCGKTAAVVLAWLWRRRFAEDEVRKKTPRRLVYCLPMRVLVEQTRDNCIEWLKNLDLLGVSVGDGEYSPSWDDSEKINVTVLMGGEDKDDWDMYPERDAIIIGTQDMLLSRALNRGYGMSKYRWPMHFGLLNNDCLWVMDEVQLMGVGVETTSQMDAFRRKLGCFCNCESIWMSATTDTKQLKTVDQDTLKDKFKLSDEDQDFEEIKKRKNGSKKNIDHDIILDNEREKTGDYYQSMTDLVLEEHIEDTLTLVIVNTVDRAQKLFKNIINDYRCPNNASLLHSRFRKPDRDRNLKILGEEGDRLIVSTQVVEAGVDIDSTTMVTEIAPWPSLVQRFGRCNRKGESKDASVYIVNVDENMVAPYHEEEIETSRNNLKHMSDVSLKDLEEVEYEPPFVVRPVVRRKDLMELFDTTPDISGNDLDISRYVREGDDKDVQVLWRVFNGEPSEDMKGPVREELCSVTIGRISKFLLKKGNDGYVWDGLDSKWKVLGKNDVRPGLVILLSSKVGGYDSSLGWTGETEKNAEVDVIATNDDIDPNESNDGDKNTFTGEWKTISDHCIEVSDFVDSLSRRIGLSSEITESMRNAGLWHDVGKAHEAFQNRLFDGVEGGPDRQLLYAKSDRCRGRKNFIMNGEKKQERKHFRHELASALAYWKYTGKDRDDLAAYLVAAHHGKVRQSIRSLPDENEPGDRSRLFARGIWDGDSIPSVPGIMDNEVRLDLSPMIMGEGSWLEMAISLQEKYGPFKLAYLEALMKASDENVSRSIEEVIS